MEENRSFSVIGSLPPIQSAITMGKDSVRIKVEVPLHNQDQRNKIMYLQNLMNCVFKLTFTIEETNQQDYFYPKPKQEIQEPEPAEEPQDESVEEVTYQSPDNLKDLDYLRSTIFLELKAAGLELRVSEIYQAIVGQKRLRNCTIDETRQIWNCITNGKPEPDQNRTNLRSRMLQLIGGV
jgi:hypothetical protein